MNVHNIVAVGAILMGKLTRESLFILNFLGKQNHLAYANEHDSDHSSFQEK
jgi:hypothetical protein